LFARRQPFQERNEDNKNRSQRYIKIIKIQSLLSLPMAKNYYSYCIFYSEFTPQN